MFTLIWGILLRRKKILKQSVLSFGACNKSYTLIQVLLIRGDSTYSYKMKDEKGYKKFLRLIKI